MVAVALSLPAAVAATLPPRPGRNQPCHCGSRRKYKRCCIELDEAAAREQRGVSLPPWLLNGAGRLHQFERYACEVFGLPRLLRQLTDTRRDPKYCTFEVVNSLVHAALLRLPSINALEGDLTESDFQKLIGRKPTPATKAFSAEVIYNVLDQVDVGTQRSAIEDVVWIAERNKAFREGSYGTLRDVALDGWEPFCSFDRHCEHCLERTVKTKNPATGEVEERVQYYHRYVVAMLIDPVLDLVLDIEPVLNDEARRDIGEDPHHEGELTAALRLIDRLHATYGSFIDAFVLDALYANGPVFTKLDDYHYGGFIVLKKDDNEPLKEALAIWAGQPPCEQHDDPDKKEHIDFWDVDEIDTLSTYKGKVRVVRAVTTHEDDSRHTWCFACVGERARRLGRKAALKTVRARWHIENTGFNQWVQYWNLGHVYHHTPNATLAVLLLWALVFNLLQFFVYRRLKRRRDPKDPIDTIRHVVEVMLRDLGTIPAPIPWAALADTS
jgi:hypothetical protein